MADRANRVSFSLEPEYYELFRQIAEIMHSNMTVELRRMIDQRAVDLGLEPISPVARRRAKPKKDE